MSLFAKRETAVLHDPPHSHDPRAILFIQTSPGSIAACRRALSHEGWRVNEHFRTFENPEAAGGEIFPDHRPQLLFIGTIGVSVSAAMQLIEDLRSKNTQLVIVVLSKIDMPIITEAAINKCREDWTDSVVMIVREFLDGTLRRRVEHAA